MMGPMKALFSLLLLIFVSQAFALTDPMTDDDFEQLRKFVALEELTMSQEQNDRIYPVVKLAASQQPMDLVELGSTAKKLSEKIAKDGIDNDAILKSAAILKMKEASEAKFLISDRSADEAKALENIEALHKSLKK